MLRTVHELLGKLILVAALSLGLSGCQSESPSLPEAIPLEISDYQTEVLSDGVVTFTEYEKAFLDTIACLRDGGVRASDPIPSHDGRFLTYDIGFWPPDTPSSVITEAEALNDSCVAEYLDAIALKYSYDNQPSASEQTETRLEAIECLRKEGYDISDDLTEGEIMAIAASNPSVSGCLSVLAR